MGFHICICYFSLLVYFCNISYRKGGVGELGQNQWHNLLVLHNFTTHRQPSNIISTWTITSSLYIYICRIVSRYNSYFITMYIVALSCMYYTVRKRSKLFIFLKKIVMCYKYWLDKYCYIFEVIKWKKIRRKYILDLK